MTDAIPVWIELHVDDELLSRDPARWPEARDLVATIAQLAEDRGARLCIRFRLAFARHAQSDPLLPRLEEAGHELGVHTHGKGLAQAAQAVRACGVEPAVAVPGLVQAGPDGRAVLLRQAASLGFSMVTDHGIRQAWAYEGLAHRIEEGLVVMAPTVRPTDWGLISPQGQRMGLRMEGVERLRRLEQRAADQGAAYFGLALHEHDLCPPGSLKPSRSSLEALSSWLDARVVPSMSCLGEVQARPLRSSRPLSDRRTWLVRRVRSAVGSSRGGVEMMAHRARKSRRMRPPRGSLGEGMEWVELGQRAIVARRGGSRSPRAICLISHAGLQGGIGQGLSPFGLGERDLAREGWELWTYDRAGTGRSPAARDPSLSPGNAAHMEDWRAMLAHVRGSSLPVVAMSWSAGVLPVLRAAAEGDRPDALVDAEGPADRWSLVPPRGPKAIEMGARDPWNDQAWTDLEPVRLLPKLSRPYARLQAEQDHLHGQMSLHAERMWAAAQAFALPTWPPSILSGHLHGHPSEVLEALNWVRDRIEG
jgi:hypothetical protein